MKKIIFLISAIFITLCVKAQTISNTNPYDDIVNMEQKAHANMFHSMLSGAIDNYDIKYNRCEWTVDPAVKYIKGAVTTYFEPTTAGFSSMQFDLSDSLTVDSVKYHGTNIVFAQLPGDILELTLPGAIPVSTLDSVTVYYQGVPPSDGLGAFVQSTHSGAPVIWTLSEPFGAKDWWPCKQALNDKIDSLDIIVTTTPNNKAGSNGVLLSEVTTATSVIDHWRTKYPIAAYLVAIGVSNYVVYHHTVPLPTRYMDVSVYVYFEYLVPAQSQTPDIIQTIIFYDSLTITYPFEREKYGMLQFGWGGGMEHQTMTFLVGFSHPLMAHELAHQWFGDWVTCGSWQDIWLNEGFATFMEGLSEQRFNPSTWLGWRQLQINQATTPANGSVLCDDTTNVNRIFNGYLSYSKGGYLLRMLNWKLGNTAFWQGIKDYLNDPALGGNYAKTPQLKAHLEAASGVDLTSFFNEWYYNQGYPSYQLYWNQSGTNVSLTVNQTTSDPSVPFYEMPIPVKFIGATHDTTIVFDHTSSGQVFNTVINFPVVSVQFDPELEILSKNNTVAGIANLMPLTNGILVYPNPTRSNITVSIDLKATTEMTFELFDIQGKKIYNKTENVIAGNSLKSITTENLAKGDYILKVRGGEINFSQKVVKQ